MARACTPGSVGHVTVVPLDPFFWSVRCNSPGAPPLPGAPRVSSSASQLETPRRPILYLFSLGCMVCATPNTRSVLFADPVSLFSSIMCRHTQHIWSRHYGQCAGARAPCPLWPPACWTCCAPCRNLLSKLSRRQTGTAMARDAPHPVNVHWGRELCQPFCVSPACPLIPCCPLAPCQACCVGSGGPLDLCC